MAQTSLRSRKSCLPASASSFAILALDFVSCSSPPIAGVNAPEDMAVSLASVRLGSSALATAPASPRDPLVTAAGTFWMQRLSVLYQLFSHLRPACLVASRGGILDRKTTERQVLQQAATATRSRALSPPDETTGSCNTSASTCILPSAQLLQHAQHGLRPAATTLAAACPGQSQERQNAGAPAHEAFLDEAAAAQDRAASMASTSTSGLGAVPRDLVDTVPSGWSGLRRGAASRQPGWRRQRRVDAAGGDGSGIHQASAAVLVLNC